MNHSATKALIVEQLAQSVEIAKTFQLWGAEWEAAVQAGRAPAVLTGAYTRTRPWNATVDVWKDKVICSTLASNNNYLRISSLFAYAYNSPQLTHAYHNPELIDRIVAAIDFYSIAQGSNGGYDDRNHGKCWVGGPERIDGSGVLEGYGHMGFSAAFVFAHQALMTDKIMNATYDDDGNNATPPVPRRQGWTRLFNCSRNYLSWIDGGKFRGHAPNQDYADQLAAYYANVALRSLAPEVAYPETEAIGKVYEVLITGPQLGPPSGGKLENPWISELGISMEPGGYRGGGYSHAYGDTPIRLFPWLSIVTGGDPTVHRRYLDCLRAFTYFRYLDSDTTADGVDFVTMAKVSSITWRHEAQNGE
jgi:hypothetical protein